MIKLCVFCQIIQGSEPGSRVYEDQHSLTFLDRRPLFHGHCLIVPKEHFQTLADLPSSFLGTLFGTVQLVERAVRAAMGCQGTFVAMNNTVSQSVPHLHVHVVPRNPKDGLRGFFWPRHPYQSQEQMEGVRQKLARELNMLSGIG